MHFDFGREQAKASTYDYRGTNTSAAGECFADAALIDAEPDIVC
jgi:hypothetical protein